MSAGVLDTPLKIDMGATFVQPFVLTDPETNLPIDLTGYTAESQVRLTYDSEVLVAFTCVIDPLIGQISLELSAAASILDFPQPDGRCDVPVKTVFDLFIAKAGVLTRLVRGEAWFYPRVTQ